MKLSLIWYLNSFKQFVNSERASEVFSSTTKTLSVSLSKSVQVGHFYRELYNRNWRNSMIKIRIQFSCVKLKCLIRIDFLWRKDHIYTRHCSKQTSKLWQLQNEKFEFDYNYLPCYSLTGGKSEVNLRTLINRRWEWIILSVRSLTVLVPFFFQKCTCAFFSSYALSNWQVSDCDRYL